jgi:hypothetical protein
MRIWGEGEDGVSRGRQARARPGIDRVGLGWVALVSSCCLPLLVVVGLSACDLDSPADRHLPTWVLHA